MEDSGICLSERWGGNNLQIISFFIWKWIDNPTVQLQQADVMGLYMKYVKSKLGWTT